MAAFSLKDAVAGLNAANAKAVLSSVLDKLEAGETVAAKDLREHIATETQKAATAMLANPLRSGRVICIAITVVFVLGFVAGYVFRH